MTKYAARKILLALLAAVWCSELAAQSPATKDTHWSATAQPPHRLPWYGRLSHNLKSNQEQSNQRIKFLSHGNRNTLLLNSSKATPAVLLRGTANARFNVSAPVALAPQAQGTGNVWGWGDNGFGELGNGTTVATSTPSQVSNLSAVVAIANGCCDDEFSLALKSDGTVWAWGGNGFGELGVGTNASSSTPIQVNGLSNVIAIAAGWDHSVAVKSDGTVWAWGLNGNGELGNGSITNSNTPVQVSNLSGVIAVAAGDGESMALKSDGTVWVWGYNGNGQLGLGNTSAAPVTTPVQVSSLSGIVAIAVGNGNSLVLKNDGSVWGWGFNLDGRLGNGTTTSSSTPVQTSNLSSVIAIAAADGHSLALKVDGTAWAWGSNGNGQLGDGTTTSSTTPVQVSGLSSVTSIAAGSGYSIAVKNDGTLWAWGFNSTGQLGIGTKGITPVTAPVQVNSLSGVTGIAAGDIFTMAIQSPANGAATHFGLALPAAATVGSAVTLTVTALNASSQIALGYAGTIHFTSTDSSAILPADYVFTTADNGTHVFSVTFNSSGIQTTTVTDTISSAISGTGNITVNPEPTTTSLGASATPSVFGQQVSFTASVSPVATSSLIPTGTVTFSAQGTTLGAATLGSGTAVFNTSGLPVGTHSITAAYGGDNNFAPSTSTVLAQVVNQAGTTTSLSASPNPSSFGQSVTLTAVVGVAAPGFGTPTGTVTFLDGTTALGTGTLNSAGNATLSTSTLSSGSHSLTAVYGSDTNFTASTSPTVALTVQSSTTHLSVSAPAAATAGTAFSVTVTALNAANQTSTGYTGTVVFTSTDPQGVLPPVYKFTVSDQGTHIFSAVTLNTAGSQIITAADTANASVTGSSAPITVSSPPPPVVQVTVNEIVTVGDTESFPDVFDPEAVHVADAVFVTPLIAVTAPVAEFSAGGLGFSGQSGTQAITVSDIGQAPLTLASASISGSPQFSITQISCSSGATSLSTMLPVGGVCTLTITYSASATPSNDTATLVFNDNAALSNLPTTPSGASFMQSVPLNGGGTNIGPPPPPPTTVSVVDNEMIHVADTETFPVFDTETIHVQDQVSVATLQTVAVTPRNLTILNGARQSFVAIGTFSDATTQDLTALVTWSSSNLAVATMNGNTATAGGLGQTTITAALGSIASSTHLTVSLPFLRIRPVLSSITKSASGGYNVTISVTNTGDITANAVAPVLSILGAAITRASTPLANLAPGATATLTVTFPRAAGTSGSTQPLFVLGQATGTGPHGAVVPPARWLLGPTQITLP